jgi:hypothetical protein
MAEFADALRHIDGRPPRRPRRAVQSAAGLVALVLAAALLGWAVWAATRPGTGQRATTDSPRIDLFRAGNKWTGHYFFTRPESFGSGEVELLVSERAGSSFTGIYITRSGDKKEHRWEVAGEAEEGRVAWTLGKPLNENARKARPQSRKATCTGTYDDREMRVQYEDEHDRSQADMTLKQRRE